MKATLLMSGRTTIREGVFVDMVLWRVPEPLKGSRHSYKYRLALVAGSICVLRYDNEAGKGDHKHVGIREEIYSFTGIDRLIEDFRLDVGKWLDENGSS